MITPELIERINQLARKRKTVGLTDEELAEQTKLRDVYLTAFRQGLRSQLEQIKIVNHESKDEDGGHS